MTYKVKEKQKTRTHTLCPQKGNNAVPQRGDQHRHVKNKLDIRKGKQKEPMLNEDREVMHEEQ
jgi:hypothetical protein